MKPFALAILAASVALNLALAVLLVLGAHERIHASSLHTSSPLPSSPKSALPASTAIWLTLHSADLPALVANLRAAGFPPRLVRAIVDAQIRHLFDARRKALDPDAATRPFWKNAPPNAQLQAAHRQLDHEQNKTLRALLGPDLALDDPWSRQLHQRQFGNLPPERVAAIWKINDEFSERYWQLGQQPVPASREKYAAIEDEMQAAILAALAPAERELYELSNHPSAKRVRSRLGNFDATEQEFRAMYHLQRDYDARFARAYDREMTDQQLRERDAARRQHVEQIKAVLGPQRFADYERSTSDGYQQTTRLVARLELPAAAAHEVWSVQKDIRDRAKTVRDDRTLTEVQRTAQLAALATEASTKITTHLGPRGLEAYKDNGGTWIVELTTPSPVR